MAYTLYRRVHGMLMWHFVAICAAMTRHSISAPICIQNKHTWLGICIIIESSYHESPEAVLLIQTIAKWTLLDVS